jgi:hypothetical protein
LSLLRRPGDGTLKGRKIALLGRPGVHGASLSAVQAALVEQGAVARLVGTRIGRMPTADGDTLDADASLENEPGFLFDALVLPDGDEGVAALAQDGHTMEFIKDQFRHCKTILASVRRGPCWPRRGCPRAWTRAMPRAAPGWCSPTQRSASRPRPSSSPAWRGIDTSAARWTRRCSDPITQNPEPTMPDSSDKDACALLDADHLAVKHLFVEYARLAYAPDAEANDDRAAIAARICDELTVHAAIEEEIFYPALAARPSAMSPMWWPRPRKSTSRRKRLIAQIRETGEPAPPAPRWTSWWLTSLAPSKTNVKDERDELFPKARSAPGLDLAALGIQLKERQLQVMREAAPSVVRSRRG